MVHQFLCLFLLFAVVVGCGLLWDDVCSWTHCIFVMVSWQTLVASLVARRVCRAMMWKVGPISEPRVPEGMRGGLRIALRQGPQRRSVGGLLAFEMRFL